MAKPYQYEIDFAFFAANFGYSKAEYEALTEKEKRFLLKAYENRLVTATTMIYNAVFTATYNVERGKRKRALKLWRKQRTHTADEEIVKENLKIAEEIEQKEGKSWVDLIYQKNGMKRPERRKRG